MVGRKGPAAPGIVAFGKGIQLDKKKVDVTNTGYSTASVHCNVHVSGTGGRWYYEVRILTNGSMRVGWATEAWTGGEALGSDAEGWGFDGSQGRKYGAGASPTGYASAGWHQGDIVGCLLDLDAGTISYTHNGESLGVAFSGVAAGAKGKALWPAATLQRKQHLLFNFGEEDFCAPQPGAAALHMRVGSDDVAELERLFTHYSAARPDGAAPAPPAPAPTPAAAAAPATGRIIEGEGILQLANALG
jgi:hypothetical protein